MSSSYDSSDDDDDSVLNYNPEVKKLVTLIDKFMMEKTIIHYFNSCNTTERKRILRDVERVFSRKEGQKPPLFRALEVTSLPDQIRKNILFRCLEPGPSPAKNRHWLETVLNIPFNQYASPINSSLLFKAKTVLDAAVYGHDTVKSTLISYISQLVQNQESSGLVLGLKSYPGIGKTSLIEKGLAKLLDRPFFNVSLAGCHDSSFLKGFTYTYEGSEPGFIAQSLIRGKIMNPILFFDELDKVSNTDKGVEIIDTLIQLTDPIQSHYFQDKFIGEIIPLDLSRCIIIFAYNSSNNVNRILLDRISEIELSAFSDEEKVIIAKNYLLPDIVKDVYGSHADVAFMIEDNTLKHLVEQYTNEAGVRYLKQILYEIVRNSNMKSMMSSSPPPQKRCRRKKSLTIDMNNLQEFISTHKPLSLITVNEGWVSGKVNGLFVTSHGESGILPIEVTLLPFDNSGSSNVLVTGNLGKVMGESVHVAKSIAWSHLPVKTQEYWLKEWKVRKSFIHVHCLDAATPKDGPSAGVALSLAIWSLLMNRLIPSNIAMTGEISLGGDISVVGFVKEKLRAAKRAKCSAVILPVENSQDATITDLKTFPVSHFSQVLKIITETSNGK